jgi:hypothetical protein
MILAAIAPCTHTQDPVLPFNLAPRAYLGFSTPHRSRHRAPTLSPPCSATPSILPRREPAAPPHPRPGQGPQQLRRPTRKLPEASTLDLYTGSGRNLTETHRR